jgi:Bifunctional DNA primase/polymerase, N-terminal
MMTLLEIASDYIARGSAPLPLSYKAKKPVGMAWRIDASNVAQYFNGAPQNIGVQLGPISHDLIDVDLDCPEAIIVAQYFLPQTGAIFGRASARGAHRLYYASDLADTVGRATLQFKDPNLAKAKGNTEDDRKAMLVELRIGGGGKAAQSVFPGSSHPTGELIAWEAGSARGMIRRLA